MVRWLELSRHFPAVLFEELLTTPAGRWRPRGLRNVLGLGELGPARVRCKWDAEQLGARSNRRSNRRSYSAPAEDSKWWARLHDALNQTTPYHNYELYQPPRNSTANINSISCFIILQI